MSTEQYEIIRTLGVRQAFEPLLEIRDRIEYLRSTGLTTYVLGISGGVDSLLAGMLAQRAVDQLVVWVKVFEKFRSIVLSAGMLAIKGRSQREGNVVHLVANRLTDLSSELASVGDRDAAFPVPHGRGDEFHHGSPAPDSRSVLKGMKARDFFDPYGHIDTIKVKTRDFK